MNGVTGPAQPSQQGRHKQGMLHTMHLMSWRVGSDKTPPDKRIAEHLEYLTQANTTNRKLIWHLCCS